LSGVLQSSKTWKIKVDLETRFSIVGPQDKKIVLIELTVPWEERCDETYEPKSAKYTQFTEDCRKKGWKAWLFPVEVGTRGFPAKSMRKMLTETGITGHKKAGHPLRQSS
jgi:hypothetical protein